MATRVLVVEDSPTVQEYLCGILASDPEIEVVGRASDGKLAIELCQRLRPDVVTLDMMLPVMSGLAATEYIMAHVPTPILIVSASTNRGELFRTYEALAAGAVDVMEKPGGSDTDQAWDQVFLATVKLVARIKVITHPRGRISPRLGAISMPRGPGSNVARTPRVLAVGASTGGPAAIVTLLRALPAPYPHPILVVMHIDDPFASAFADWLDGQTPHSVRFARDGELLLDLCGQVRFAPPYHHLVVRNRTLGLTKDPERHSCRPSVDVLFESLATDLGREVAACLLTGMGRDGAHGLKTIRDAGGLTLAQDEASCVVYGMPREAVLLGAAEHVLPLSEMGGFLGRFP